MSTLKLLATAALVVSTAAGCAGTQFARTTNAEKLPSNGAAGGPGANALPVQMVAPDEWAGFPKDKGRLAPACDARGAAPKADAAQLDKAEKLIAEWDVIAKKRPPPKPPSKDVTVGQVLGIPANTSRDVRSIALTCKAGAPPTLEVNGVTHAFDLAYTYTGTNATSKATSMNVQAISLKEKKIVFARVTVSHDPKFSESDIVVIANIAGYFPADADEPIVHNTSTTEGDCDLETLIPQKGATEGFYYLVPRQDLALEYYLTVGRFKVGAS